MLLSLHGIRMILQPILLLWTANHTVHLAFPAVHIFRGQDFDAFEYDLYTVTAVEIFKAI